MNDKTRLNNPQESKTSDPPPANAKAKPKTQELTEEYFNHVIHSTLVATYDKDEENMKYKKFCASNRAFPVHNAGSSAGPSSESGGNKEPAMDSDALIRNVINSIDSDDDGIEITEISGKRKDPDDGKVLLYPKKVVVLSFSYCRITIGLATHSLDV